MGDTFGVNDWDNMPGSNVLEKGRYEAEVESISKHTSSAGNKCIKIEVRANKIKITDFIVLTDANGKKHQMSFRWKEFLYAIGIRDNRRTFEVDEERIVGSKCKIDVTKDKDKNLGEQNGITVWKNTIRYYAPILEETAPITGVPAEDEGKTKPETKKDTDIDGL